MRRERSACAYFVVPTQLFREALKKSASCVSGAEAPEYLQQLRRRPEGQALPEHRLAQSFLSSRMAATPAERRPQFVRSFAIADGNLHHDFASSLGATFALGEQAN